MAGRHSGAPPGKERTGPHGRNRPPEKNIDLTADTASVATVYQFPDRSAAARERESWSMPEWVTHHNQDNDKITPRSMVMWRLAATAAALVSVDGAAKPVVPTLFLLHRDDGTRCGPVISVAGGVEVEPAEARKLAAGLLELADLAEIGRAS